MASRAPPRKDEGINVTARTLWIDEKSLRKSQRCSKMGLKFFCGKSWKDEDVFCCSCLRHDAGHRRALGEYLADATNLRTHAFELFFNALISEINVIDPVNDGFAVGDQGCNHE